MSDWLRWFLSALAAMAIFSSFALVIVILLHRTGRATGRFDRRED